jgi:hypothetical protein
MRLPPLWAEQPAMWFAQAEAVYLGRHQQRSDQVLLCDLAAGPPVCRENRGYHHLSAGTRTILHAEDQACEAAVPIKRATHPPVPLHSRGWATTSHPSFSDTSGASHQMCQTTFSTASCPAGYPPPPNIRAILAGQPEGDLDAAAPCADRIPAGAQEHCATPRHNAFL